MGEQAKGDEDELQYMRLFEDRGTGSPPRVMVAVFLLEYWQVTTAKVAILQGPDLLTYLWTRQFLTGLSHADQGLYASKALPYTLLEAALYQQRPDQILR